MQISNDIAALRVHWPLGTVCAVSFRETGIYHILNCYASCMRMQHVIIVAQNTISRPNCFNYIKCHYKMKLRIA